MKIRKRDGREVDFNKDKIFQAVEKARAATQNELIEIEGKLLGSYVAEVIELNIEDIDLDIEAIQNIIEEILMEVSPAVAKNYIIYREERTKARGNIIDKTIEEVLDNSNEYWRTENSNKDSKIVSTQRDYLAGVISEDLARRKIFPKDVIAAHDKGVVYQHDMDYMAQQTLSNCCLVNLEDMLQNGTVMNGVKIDKPKRLLTATTIATQIILGVTSSQYGGCSISIAHLAPFVRDSEKAIREKYVAVMDDKELIEKLVAIDLAKEIRDSVQTLQFQILSMQNCNGQSAFATVGLYLSENKEYIRETAMLIEEVLKQRILGIKNEKGVYITPAFPKLIYMLEENNIHEDSEYYYLTRIAAECTAKRLVPDYISEKVMKKLKNGQCFPMMGCRSALSYYETEDGTPKFYGRFNCGVVTLNLPYIALESKGNQASFWSLLNDYAEIAHKGLKIRCDRLSRTVSDAAPIMWQGGALARLEKGETLEKLVHNGYATASLGYAGIYECVKYMIGQSHTEEEGKKFGLGIMEALNGYTNQWSEEENIGYSIYGTPIESTTYKFAKANKRDFGIVEGITDREYITNSYHIPVFEEIDAFSKLEKESAFQALSTGGAISYIETPNMSSNIDAVLQVMSFMYDNIMYAEINSKSDYCQACGYDGEIQIKGEDKLYWECPSCGNRDQDTMNIARRTCGYIGTNYWNQGRTAEIKDRVVHLDN